MSKSKVPPRSGSRATTSPGRPRCRPRKPHPPRTPRGPPRRCRTRGATGLPPGTPRRQGQRLLLPLPPGRQLPPLHPRPQDPEDLCRDFENDAPRLVEDLRKKRDHYLAFLDYPTEIPKTLSMTSAVEAINGQLERLRQHNGGYFHSHDILEMKLDMLVLHLENHRWRRTPAFYASVLPRLNAMCEARFEVED